MGCLSNIVAGMVGAAVGGWVFSFFGGYSVTGLNWQSLVVSLSRRGHRAGDSELLHSQEVIYFLR